MGSDTPSSGIVRFEQARRIVEQHARAVPHTETEVTDLRSANGRVLAEPITADRDFPPFPRATRDGFAVRAQDVEQVPAMLQLIGEIRAGSDNLGFTVGPGQA